MGDRTANLSSSAQGQVSELLELLASCEEGALQKPCPGREKLGDGTLATVCAHVAQNYTRIAAFLAGEPLQSSPPPSRGLRSRVASALTRRGHRAGHGPWMHDGGTTAREIDRAVLIDRLTSARAALRIIDELSDEQLDQVPPPQEAMRFCDGTRTLEQVVGSLLKHQGHQVAALSAGFGG